MTLRTFSFCVHPAIAERTPKILFGGHLSRGGFFDFSFLSGHPPHPVPLSPNTTMGGGSVIASSGDDERVVDGRISTIVLPTRSRTAKRIDGEKDVLIVEGERGGLQVQSFAFPLDFYLRKQFISRAQWHAGVRYHRLWRQGCLSGYVQFQYREGDGGERNMQFVPPGAFALEWRNAQLAIRGVSERRVAYSVCYCGHFLNTCPQFPSLRTARRKGMPLLLTALEDLIAYFIVIDEEKRRSENPC